MRTLHLHGFLKEKYGDSFMLEVDTPKEAVHALCVQLPGFREDIAENNWHVVRGALEDADSDDEEKISLHLGQLKDIHLIPAIEGAKNGLFATIVGVAMIAVGVVTGQPWLIGMGVGTALGGIIQMTTKLPSGVDPASQESADQRPSFIFQGAVNTSSQGLAVPRGYGRLRIGSIVISAALYAENWEA